MDQENIMFFKNDNKSNTMVNLYLNNKFFGYKDLFSYYEIDVDKLLLFKKSNNEYIIRYNDVNKMTVVPLQLKINNFFGKSHKLKNNIRLVSIQTDDKELFRKIREIRNKIIELIVINNAKDFVKNTIDDNSDEFILIDVHRNTNFAEGNYRNNSLIVILYVIDDYLKTSLVYYRY